MTTREWLGLLFRQTAYALTTVTGILLIGEIMLPGLVLPFLNLHVLGIVTLAADLYVASIAHEGGDKLRPYRRVATILPIAFLLIAYVFFALAGPCTGWCMAGNGPSAMLLAGAITGMILLAGWAITKPD